MGKPPKSYGPLQLATRLGLSQWQMERGRRDGHIDGPDRPDGRWSDEVVTAMLARIDQITAAIGAVPDVGAWAASEELTARLGVNVEPHAIQELHRMGLLPVVGEYKGHDLYCGRTLESFTDKTAVAIAMRNGKLHLADEAAEYMRIRRSDFDHLVRAGRVKPASWCRDRFASRRSAPTVPLYRTGDLDGLLRDPSIDWAAVRATPKGRPSPLAVLPTVLTGD